MDDYHEFCDAHEANIEERHQYQLPNYFSITKGRLAMSTPTPLTTTTRAGAGPSTPWGNGSGSTVKAQVLIAFNPIIEFFEELRTNYQGVEIKKFHTLQEFYR